MMRLRIVLIICLVVVGWFGLQVDQVNAVGLDDLPTPTPFPTWVPRVYYTNTLDYETSLEIYQLIPITDTHEVGTLDFGLWDYDNYVLIVRTANTIKHLGNKYHFFDIMFSVAIIGLVIGPLVHYIKARGDRG